MLYLQNLLLVILWLDIEVMFEVDMCTAFLTILSKKVLILIFSSLHAICFIEFTRICTALGLYTF